MRTSHAETKPAAAAPRGLLGAVVRGAAAGVGLNVVHLALRFALTPFILARAGMEAYGLWSLVFVTFGALGLHRSGLVGSATAVAASQVAARDIRGARRTLGVTATIAYLVAAVATAAIMVWAPALAALLGTEGADAESAALLLRVVVVATAIQLATTSLHCGLEALQRHAYLRCAEMGSAIFEAGLVFVGLLVAPKTTDAAVLVLGGAFVGRAATLLILHARAIGATRAGRVLRVLPTLPTRAELRRLLPFAGTLQLLGSLHLAVLGVPRFVLGWTLGLATVGAFEAGRKLVELTAALPLPAIAPLAPASAALTSTDGDGAPDLERAQAPLRATTRLVSAAGALVLGALFAGAERISVAWLGHADAAVEMTLRILAPASAIHLATGPVTAMLRGVRRPAAELTYSAAWLVLSLVLVLAGSTYGLEGALMGVAISQALVCAWLLSHAAPQVGLHRRALLEDAARGLVAGVTGAAAGALIALALPAPATRIEAALQLGPIGAAVAAASVATALYITLDRAQRAALLATLKRRGISWA